MSLAWAREGMLRRAQHLHGLENVEHKPVQCRHVLGAEAILVRQRVNTVLRDASRIGEYSAHTRQQGGGVGVWD